MGLAQTTPAGGKQTAVGKQPAQGKCQVADGAEGSWQEGAGYLAGARIPGLALDFHHRMPWNSKPHLYLDRHWWGK